MELFTNQGQKSNKKNYNITNKTYESIIMYGIAITYAASSFLLLGSFVYTTIKMTSKK